MAIDEDSPPSVPAWTVTFSDMMTLLLTFFIMLVSMSELKYDDRLYAMLDGVQSRFGDDSLLPGELTPGDAAYPLRASEGRSRRKDLMTDVDATGNATVDAPGGPSNKASIDPELAGVIVFGDDGAQLDADAETLLLALARQLAGQRQSIELCGHTSREPLDPHLGHADHWGLAYERAHAVMQFLVQQGIQPARIRLSSAGAYQPVAAAESAETNRRSARVEVLVYDERAAEP